MTVMFVSGSLLQHKWRSILTCRRRTSSRSRYQVWSSSSELSSLRFLRFFAGRHFDECDRHDPPGDAELVLKPPALSRLTAVRGQLLPVEIDFGLRSRS
jgi:hypothetical protein